jgi:hypothetical protein
MRNADAFSADPETVEWIWRVFSWLHGLSTSIALVIWGVVALAILAVPWLFDRLVGRSTVLRTPPPWVQPPMSNAAGPNGPMPRAGEDGVIDLGPDQYRVEPGEGRSSRGGSVPRIVPRG